jgi:hypothetical protein
MERPDLNKDISLTDFNDFYWLKQELIDFCKTVGINPYGAKIEIADRIRQFIQAGKVVENESNKNKRTSNFDWDKEVLTRATIIQDNYKNGENVRNFFVQEIGTHFSFNIIFMKWMKENIGKTLEDAIIEWNRINELKKDKNYVSEIDSQFEYNRYMRAFLNDNPHLSSKDAMKYWKLKRAKRGTNEYEKSDLDLK